MKYIFSTLIILHGTIHLMGFLKAFRLAQIEQLSCEISKISGIFWLVTSVLFIVSGIAYIVKTDSWYIPAFIAVLISQSLLLIYGRMRNSDP